MFGHVLHARCCHLFPMLIPLHFLHNTYASEPQRRVRSTVLDFRSSLSDLLEL